MVDPCSTAHIQRKDKDESYVKTLGSIMKVYISDRLLVAKYEQCRLIIRA